MTNSERDIAGLIQMLMQDFSRIAKISNDRKITTDELIVRLYTLLDAMRRQLPFSPTQARRLDMLIDQLKKSRSKAEVRGMLGETEYLLRGVNRDILVHSSLLTHDDGKDEMEERLSQLETLVRESNKTRLSEKIEDIKEITLESLAGKEILFGIMPFGVEFDDVWEGAIKKAAGNAGLYPLRINMLTKSSNITEDIIEAIRMAKVVVVDVTKNNPNVMFEFGYALALKKAPVIITQSIDELPFDIQSIRAIPYRNSWMGIEKLHEELQTFVKSSYKPKQKKSN